SIEVPADQELQQWTLGLPARAGVYLLWGPKREAILLATSGSVRASVRRKLARSESETLSRRTKLAEITKGVSWTQADSSFVSYWQFHQLAKAIYPSSYGKMLGWSNAWWIRICLSEPFGRLLTGRKISPPDPDEYIGPFVNGKAAKYFVDLASDIYGLCRDYEILQQTATEKAAQACAYAQMGKCCGACLGRVSASEYRGLLLEAVKLAEPKERLSQRRRLEEQMSRAAAKLDFESAAKNKKLIKRLGKLEEEDFGWAGSLRRFEYLIIAPGRDRHQVRPWRVNGGTVEPGEAVRLGEVERQIGEIVDWAKGAEYRPPASRSEIQQWRESIGLVSYFLFRSHSDKCLYYKLDHLAKEADLAEQINSKFSRNKAREAKDRTIIEQNITLKNPPNTE
ncbi:MAG: UvrB/UvrC motif-containing protein, partial [Phycisphaerae bacterium]|nr:UvrB/UvrC motif-containing protein [Phycisphaerae bacterium]